MIAITSISPTHINKGIQFNATKSWSDLGLNVYSMNCKAECDLMRSEYPHVTFIETDRTMEGLFRKPYVSLTAIFDWCKKSKESYFCLINSDIELKTDKDTIKRIKLLIEQNNVVLINRVNHNGDYQGHRYLDGIDAFFMGINVINTFPPTLFCLGQCHFDYFIPYHSSKKGFELVFSNQNIAFHLNHSAQYNSEDWVKTGNHFIWLTELHQFTNQVSRMSQYIFNYIYNVSKRIEL